jgi:hypothetical protein
MMVKQFLLAIIAVVLVLGIAEQAQAQTSIVGTWRMAIPLGGIIHNGTITFNSNSTFQAALDGDRGTLPGTYFLLGPFCYTQFLTQTSLIQ